MRLFALLIFSFAVFGFAAAQGYTPIQWDPNNQQLVNILNTGLKEAASKARGDLVWNQTNVNRVETMSSGETTDYYFIVLLESDQGDFLLDLFLNVDNTGKVTLVDDDLHNT